MSYLIIPSICFINSTRTCLGGNHNTHTQEDLTSLKREIAILHRCRSDFVVEFKVFFARLVHGPNPTMPTLPIIQYDTTQDCFFADNELWIVMEFCMGGSVADILDATEKTLTEPQARCLGGWTTERACVHTRCYS